MENKLEQLLNRLIEKGWKWKGKEKIEKTTIRLSESWQVYFGTEEHPYLYADTLRGITSKNSGLWQFVCENDLIKHKWNSNYAYFNIHGTGKAYEHWNYEYRLIKSSLKDESELEDFLLNSIVINND